MAIGFTRHVYLKLCPLTALRTYRFAAALTHSDQSTRYTPILDIIRPELKETVALYRVVNQDGFASSDSEPTLAKADLLQMFRTMVLLNTMDRIMFESQRQGRISFYMTNYGEEACQIGSAFALDKGDLIYGQYREAGVLLSRGMTLEQMMDQCYSNVNDCCKGRQMPVHYGSLDANFSTISSPLATQVPVAVGSAYSYKLARNGQVVACYFGEGASSEGDTFVALNFAATLRCPILFICRNNGYAISTPANEQYRGDGIVVRAHALGIAAVRVDGNDIFAMFNATKAARQLCLNENRPALIEAMTYRVGHHSTSDDSLAYRTAQEVSYWDKEHNPILRLRNYLFRKNWLTEEEEKHIRDECHKQVMSTIPVSEAKLKPSPVHLFTDVYSRMPSRLTRQMEATKEHTRRHSESYPLNKYEHFD